jgi:Zn-dependent protease with chaperone function
MEPKRRIRRLAAVVAAQVGLFGLTYVATIAVGLGLVGVALYACICGVPWFVERVVPMLLDMGILGVGVIVAGAVAVAGLWAFFAAVGFFLIKPLLLLLGRRCSIGIEIMPQDYPELFDVINRTAKAVGVKPPKRVYVNHDVNACVLFNANIFNLFGKSRNNLLIGLGLFETTSVEEVRGIIAHEFGHLTQNSMRVGSLLYVSNQIISDLVYRRDKLDSWLLQWCLKRGLWGFWGRATQAVVITFRRLIEYLFRCQQRSYMKLSRQMEYDADAVACKVVGTDVFVSALCKTQKLGKAFDFYHRVLSHFACQNQMVEDYWRGFNTLAGVMATNRNTALPSFNVVESQPEAEDSRSRVAIEEVWQSHPSLDKRICYVRQLNLPDVNQASIISAQTLIDDRLKSAVSSDVLARFKQGHDGLQTISDAVFAKELATQMRNSLYPSGVEPFFNRCLLLDSSRGVGIIANPLSDSNKHVVCEYEQALRDREVLLQLSTGKIPVRNFRYNGAEYSVDDMPMALHERYLAGLRYRVACIDLSIRQLAVTNAADRKYVDAAYRAIEYAQSITERLRVDFLPVKDDIIRELNTYNIAGIHDYLRLKVWLHSYELALKDVLRSLRYQQLIPFMTQDGHAYILAFMTAPSTFSSSNATTNGLDAAPINPSATNSINPDAINRMFAITDWVMNVHEGLCHAAKSYVISTLQRTPLPYSAFLSLWLTDIGSAR